MAKRKWLETTATLGSDPLTIAVQPDGEVYVRIRRYRKSYSVPLATLYEALRARDALGLAGTTVPLLNLELGRIYMERGTDRPVYLFRLSAVEYGRRPTTDGNRWAWWLLAPTEGRRCLGRGTAASKYSADDEITACLARLDRDARFLAEDPAAGDDDDAAAAQGDFIPRA